jgi:hypothetical protein
VVNVNSNKYLAPPPEGVLAGESVPREDEKEGYEKMYDRLKKTRCRMLDRGLE